jgi:hypothetical protein
VLLLGGTGAGKSTLSHFLAGSKMVRSLKVGSRSIYILEPESILPDLENTRIGHESRSETKGINAIEVTCSETQKKKKEKKKKSIFAILQAYSTPTA